MAVSNDKPDQVEDDFLALLPAPVMLNHVFPRLGPSELVMLGSCCRALHAAAFADDVWRPRCEALGWGGFPRGTSWQAGFSSRRRTLCVECGSPSRYVFALLGCRLCDKCEHRSPKYGLVTALEAAERYGVPYAALAALQSHETCRTRFYLRTAVEAIARTRESVSYAGGSGTSSDVQDEEEDEQEDGEEQEVRRAPAAAADYAQEAEEALGSSGSSGSDSEAGGGGRGGTGADRRAQEKAARKAAKKAAKEVQRMKRQLRHVAGGGRGGLGPGGGLRAGYTPASTPAPGASSAAGGQGGGAQRQRLQQPQQPAGGGAGSGGTRGRRRGGAATVGSSPPGCRPVGPLLLLDDGEGAALPLPLEGQAVMMPHSRGRRAHAGGGAGRSGSGVHGGGVGGARPGKLKSGWAAEREALMAAWGQYGISGLVLAS